MCMWTNAHKVLLQPIWGGRDPKYKIYSCVRILITLIYGAKRIFKIIYLQNTTKHCALLPLTTFN